MYFIYTSSFTGLQKPVFTAKGQVVNGKQRVMATVKENLQNNASQIPAVTTKTAASIGGKRKASMLNASRDINTSTLSMAGKQILKGVRTNRRFGKKDLKNSSKSTLINCDLLPRIANATS